jgi:glycerate kinase
LLGVPIVVAADVMSPLVGADGAARVFGPQKGATPQMIESLERGLENLGKRIEADLGVPVLDAPGAGAAGGAGAMLLGLGARLQSGAEVVLEAIDFAQRARNCDLVITGEGKLDDSTVAGKLPIVVARAAAAEGKLCIAIVGVATTTPPEFTEVRTLVDHFNGSERDAQQRATAGLQAIAARLVSDRRRI